MVDNKKSSSVDLNPAARAPDEYPESPPAGYEDKEDSAEVRESKSAVMVGAILSKLSKQDVDTLYKVLAPLTKKMGWYASRYWTMQEKIRWYKSEHSRLVKKCREYEERFNVAEEMREIRS